MAISTRAWRISFGYDRRTRGGRKYSLVDDGTGIHVGDAAYPIVPKHKKVLKFTYPTPVKTTPGIPGIGPGLVWQQGAVDRGVIFTKTVMHPGIRPRHFSKSLRDFLNSRTRPGGLRSTSDAAVKRAFRKMSR